MQCKQMRTFLKVFICGNKFYVFSKVTSLISPKVCRLNCALLCDASLLVMNAKDKKSGVFIFSKKTKVDFLLEVLLFL